MVPLLARAQGAGQPLELKAIPVWTPFGAKIPPDNVQRTGREILSSLEGNTPYDYMTELATVADVPSGLKDRYGNDQPFNVRWDIYANPLIRAMFDDVGSHQRIDAGDCTAWCAATVGWCMMKCGYKFTKYNKEKKKDLRFDPVVAVSWADYGKKVDDPQPGDLAVFQNIESPGHGHVGFYVSSDKEKNTLTVKGGNQNQPAGRVHVTECGGGVPNNFIGDHVFPLNPTKDDHTSLRLIGYYRYSSLPH
ncbi:hypothetical protein PTKU15_93170 [Paraburkholderia terrae]|nr:hypothetical protein PTKU15_93170 [Paraburkholderia terrae]